MHYTLCDYALDIAQNAMEAGSGLVRCTMDESPESIRVVVSDDGRGMSAEERTKALDPFYSDGTKHAKRKVGLGLPFLVQAVNQADGDFSLESEKARGTTVGFGFPKGNIDCPPTGDVPGLFLSLLCFPGDHELVIERSLALPDGRRTSYELRRSELRQALGGLELASNLVLLREYLESQEESDIPADC